MTVGGRDLLDVHGRALGWAESILGPLTLLPSPRSGSYNDHLWVRTRLGREAIIRVKRTGVRELDSRPLPEFEVLATIFREPQMSAHLAEPIAQDAQSGFALHSFVGDDSLNDVAPKEQPMAAHVLTSLPQFMAQLADVRIEPDWHAAQAAFARSLGATDEATTIELNVRSLLAVYRSLFADNEHALRVLRMPSPSGLADLLRVSARPRRRVLIHGDIHRKNMRVSVDSPSWYLLDWEMAQVGDAVYDLAVALWKFKLTAADRQRFLGSWADAMPDEAIAGWESDLTRYIDVERLKTACVHIYRTADALRKAPPGKSGRVELVWQWLSDRAAASDLLGEAAVDPDEALAALESVR